MMPHLDSSLMEKDVGQNLQSKSHSRNRGKWVTQLQKEGPLLKLHFHVFAVWTLLLELSVGSLIRLKDVSLAKGEEHSALFILYFVSFSGKFRSASIKQNLISCFSLSAIPSALEVFPLCKWNKTKEKYSTM